MNAEDRKLVKEWDKKLAALGLGVISHSEFIPAKPMEPRKKRANNLDVHDGQDGKPS